MLCLLALVAAIVVWAVNSGGGGGGTGNSAPTGSHTPVASITPGPDPSGTHITGRPGGRDTTAPGDGSASGGTAAGGSDTGGSGGSDGGSTAPAGSDGSPGTTPTSGTGSDAGPSGGADGSASGGAGGTGGTPGGAGNPAPLQAGSTMPNCAPATVSVTLTSVSNSYSPGETPAFQLHATNSGAVACKIDVGPRSAVFTITASDNHHVWASDDCPSGGPYPVQVPAHSSTTFTLRWDGKTSSPDCASPKGQQAGPGTYLVQAKLPGYNARQVSFVLSAD